MSNATIYLSDYQPPAFTVTAIALNFDLYDDHALIHNRMQLQRQHDGALQLYGDELELISIHMHDQALSPNDYRLENGNLFIDGCPDQLTLTIVTRVYPQKNTTLSGLYRSHDLLCTQCEAEGFRRMTYYLDRPDILTTFTTRITADKARFPVLLSNGNLRDSGETDDQRHWVLWQDPFKKPSYLFALVAGNLVCVNDKYITGAGKSIDLRIYVEPGNEDKCEHAMTSLKKAMLWDEQAYGREYDLDIFMIVAVSDFNMGAMENKGLNIFNAKFILACPKTATDEDYAAIESVVAHEYFHNWTGNRVTCRDWFQLSLKEGLTVFRDQEFSRDMNSRDVNRIMDVKMLRNVQFPEDASSMAHPVRPASYQEINNFYTATVYEKGAEVIRMQQTLLGKAGFRRGTDLYFQRHDGQAVTIDDFVAAMEDANGKDLTQFKRWYSQAGTPEIQVQTNFKANRLTLTFKQSCRATPECQAKEPFHIPIQIALFNASGKKLDIDPPLLELQEREQTFHFDGLEEKPIISLLRGFSAPVMLYQDSSQDELLAILRFETDGFAKWNAAQQLMLTCLTRCYAAPRREWYISEQLIEALQHVLLDSKLDMALRAELLTPPGFEELTIALTAIDVERVEEVRDFFREQIGIALFTELQSTYRTLWQQEDHAMHGIAFARRKLRNKCLWFMMKAVESQSLESCLKQFEIARTMTDQVTSFSLLASASEEAIRQKAIDNFYHQWKYDELVLDKWFAIQASAEGPDALKQVHKLLSHPAFDFKNPNKVRCVIGVFTQFNPRNFHAPDGSGYTFLTDMLLKIDAINPQIAARLATPFTRWQRLDTKRQALIKQELARLNQAKLSRDLRELVTKSL
jgi:aminopeptidase N